MEISLSIPVKDWDEFVTSPSFVSVQGRRRKTFLKKFSDILAKKLQELGIYQLILISIYILGYLFLSFCIL